LKDKSRADKVMSMSLKIGIVGLPNVGKSTLFNMLTKRQAAVANYPFTTIEPNVAVVPVPDENLEKLGQLLQPVKITPAVIEFIDIAGLVKEAHLGKGLGNQFLAKIREASALLEVVRVFSAEGGDIPHIYESIDPERDIETINFELAQAGIQKPIIYVFNIGQAQKFEPPRQYPGVVSDLSAEGAAPAGGQGSAFGGIEQLINQCYRALDLITFYTVAGGQEVRATKLKRGENILTAAEKIHSDFRGKFIKAEVVGCQDLIAAAGWLKARERGLIRTVGRDYLVRGGDVIEFKI
jgi:hypothetical protein